MLVGNVPNKYNCAGCGQPVTMINSTVGKCLCCENFNEVSASGEINIIMPTEEPKPDSKLSPELKTALIVGVGAIVGLMAAKIISGKKKGIIETRAERKQARMDMRAQRKKQSMDAKIAMRERLKNDNLSTWADMSEFDDVSDNDVTFTQPLND